MPSTFSNNLKLELMAQGEKSGIWGDITNSNLALVDEALAWGFPTFPLDQDYNFFIPDGLSSGARAMVLYVQSSVELTQPTAAPRALIVSPIAKTYIVHNRTLGGKFILFKSTTSGVVWISNGGSQIITISTSGALLTATNELSSGLNLYGRFCLPSMGGASISGANHNWAPPDGLITYASAIWISCADASTSITGMAGGKSGQVLTIKNSGAHPLTLTDEDGSSTDINRFAFGLHTLTPGRASITLQHLESIELIYNGRWYSNSRHLSTIDGGIF